MIEGWEGCPPTTYRDSVGVLTGGFGHTGPDVPPEGTPVSRTQADAWLASDLSRFESAVAALAPRSTQGQFDAMVSFAYNLGEGALRSSTLLKKHNAGDFAGAADEFLKWNHAGGQVLAGLTRRREGERAVYLSDSAPASVPDTSTTAKRSISFTSATDLQSALKTLGFYQGAIDGIFGPQSMAALTAYLGESS